MADDEIIPLMLYNISYFSTDKPTFHAYFTFPLLKFHKQNEKITWVFIFKNVANFEAFRLVIFIKHKTNISEECIGNKLLFAIFCQNSKDSMQMGILYLITQCSLQ